MSVDDPASASAAPPTRPRGAPPARRRGRPAPGRTRTIASASRMAVWAPAGSEIARYARASSSRAIDRGPRGRVRRGGPDELCAYQLRAPGGDVAARDRDAAADGVHERTPRGGRPSGRRGASSRARSTRTCAPCQSPRRSWIVASFAERRRPGAARARPWSSAASQRRLRPVLVPSQPARPPHGPQRRGPPAGARLGVGRELGVRQGVRRSAPAHLRPQQGALRHEAAGLVGGAPPSKVRPSAMSAMRSAASARPASRWAHAAMTASGG